MLSRLSKAHIAKRLAQNIQVTQVQGRQFGAFVNHRDTEDNLEETPFEFTEENYKLIYEKL